ncbi:MAG: protein adenylyltransferase SelO, partial [Noviherbaspirillum sp.]
MNAPGPTALAHRTDALPFENSFASLPPAFYTRLQPTPVPVPYLVCGSTAAAESINLDPAEFAKDEFIQAFAGNRNLPGSQPLSAVYSGHQFGVWAGQLGDGRAILLGDVPAAAGSTYAGSTYAGRTELQLKGSGLTPYSRMADGRAVLRSSIREFLCSEAMAALGIPTTRALCVVGTDMWVMRETPETGAIATRMSPSFVRFGSFEHWYYNDRKDELRILADYVIDRFYPDLCDAPNRYQAFLAEVTRRTAHLIAQWQAVGFMHGVMNTDNMSILGLTIDYGPFGFMEAFNARHICNHSDQQGRYAYHMQPKIGQWNCYALGQALLPLIGEVDDVQAALEPYGSAFESSFDALLHAKLGLQSAEADDHKLINALFALMQNNHADFTLFFRRLGDLRIDDATADEPLRDLFIDRPAFDAWAQEYRLRLRRENSSDAARRTAMHAVNPK